jgi:hypothetical protein
MNCRQPQEVAALEVRSTTADSNSAHYESVTLWHMPTIAACPFLSVVHKQLLISLTLLDIVGGIPTRWSSSVGMMTFPNMMGKSESHNPVSPWFQTTNQPSLLLPGSLQTLFWGVECGV